MAHHARSPGGWPADLQDGVLTRAQALASGVTRSMIRTRLLRGDWQRLHPGVYATFSGVPARNCLLWAAVLRAGPGSALSHQTAAQLWGLQAPAGPTIHVTVPRGSPVAGIPDVTVHYSQRVEQARHPVLAPPRTTIENTVLDLAAVAVSPQDAAAWILRAVASRQTTSDLLAASLRERGRMRWRPEIASVLDMPGVHSILEFRYLDSVERPHGLPPGRRQRLLRRAARSQYADVAYDAYATLVELDGRMAHPEEVRWLDSQRDNANTAAGWVTLRYGWHDVTENSCSVAAEVALTLCRRGWPGRLRRCGPACRLPQSQASRSC
jgi:hypothetical protein